MEGIIQYVKDRTKLFDNYIPCMRINAIMSINAYEVNSIHTKQTWINRKIKAKNS